VAVFVLILPFGCARLSPVPRSLPFPQKEANRLIAALDEAGEETTSFQGFGNVRFKDGEEESESNLLVVGCRPFRVRLEISHPWGKPLVHIVVDEENISVVSLIEKKFFKGHSNPLTEYYFFLLGLDLGSAWKILSGRVPILPHSRAVSMKPNEVTLYNDGGEVVETISFSSTPLLPRSVTFPKKGITVVLSDFKGGEHGLNPMKIQAVKWRYDTEI